MKYGYNWLSSFEEMFETVKLLFMVNPGSKIKQRPRPLLLMNLHVLIKTTQIMSL